MLYIINLSFTRHGLKFSRVTIINRRTRHVLLQTRGAFNRNTSFSTAAVVHARIRSRRFRFWHFLNKIERGLHFVFSPRRSVPDVLTTIKKQKTARACDPFSNYYYRSPSKCRATRIAKRYTAGHARVLYSADGDSCRPDGRRAHDALCVNAKLD